MESGPAELIAGFGPRTPDSSYAPMTAETAHHPSGPMTMAMSLAAVAGFIDAHLFLHVTSVFVANMSGNMVRLGIDTGDGHWTTAAASFAALVAFTIGVIGAIAHHDHQLRTGRRVRPDQLLIVEMLLTLALPIMLIAGHVEFSASPRWIHVAVISLGAFAMGIQASALRRVGQIAVATTYGTGTIVRIGEKAALAIRRADRVGDQRRITTVAVLVAVLVSYIGGAALASALGSAPALLFVPPAVLGLFAMYVHFDARFQIAFTRSRARLRADVSIDA